MFVVLLKDDTTTDHMKSPSGVNRQYFGGSGINYEYPDNHISKPTSTFV